MRPSQRTISRARNLRQNPTNAEQLAWKLLRNRAALGVKFRRQHSVGNYVVDFYCPERQLVIELDGSVHSQPSQARRDERKHQFLQQQGIQVLRIANGWVLEDPEGFIKKVLASLPSPVPLRGTPSP
ncbi:MAG TPA: endonuclease domain-containing protein [Terriglobia bacterium]|nr:endonuclease domain-containing protein [Terriglobia bacterium]